MNGAAIVLILLAACGDDRSVIEQIDPVSGTRVKLEKFLYEDGTRQVDSSAFYDTRLHARCTPRMWGDGVLRCVPLAADALYSSATCTTAVGVEASLHSGPAADLKFVTHFIGYDRVDGMFVPSRLYGAGEPTTAISAYYELREGECIGPLPAPAGVAYYAVTAEIAGVRIAPLDEVEAGTGRIALQLLTSEDGMRVPVALRDRVLDAPCTQAVRPDGAVCEPVDAAVPTWFSDAGCIAPVVVIDAESPAPPVARRTDADGCASYAPVAGDVSGPLYRRDGAACVRTTKESWQRALAVGEALELPALERTIEAPPVRRLAGVILEDPADPALRFATDALVDRATRDECHRELVDDTVRCMPASTRPAIMLSTDQCAVPIPVVALPARTCGSVTFATMPALDGAGRTLHAIGSRVTAPLTILRGDQCVPYEAGPGVVLYEIGPVVPPETFLSAVSYGER